MEGVEVAGADGVADAVDEPDDEALVVNRAQGRSQDLLGLEQVMDVGAGVVRAGVAVSLGVERSEIAFVTRAGDVVTAVR